jgi:predicted alpha/beta-hydrolase family hydrolase
MTARVREADGTPYEHVLDIQEAKKKFEVQFNTKYKRIRRTTKRFQARQAAAAAEDANAAAEVASELQEGEWIAEDDEETKRSWRIVEWGEEDEESTARQVDRFI